MLDNIHVAPPKKAWNDSIPQRKYHQSNTAVSNHEPIFVVKPGGRANGLIPSSSIHLGRDIGCFFPLNPETLNPKPQTLNPKPQTPSPY